MNQTLVYHGQDNPLHKRMLFVRSNTIIETMVKIPLLIAGLFIMMAAMPLQPALGTKNLDLVIYPDGTTHVSATLDVDPLDTSLELELYGQTIDNLVAQDNNGFILQTEIVESKAFIETFDSSEITVEYDIHDLVSKSGRVWTFHLDSPADFTLLLPANSAIVGMTTLPLNMEQVGNQTSLALSAGTTEIDYLFSAASLPSGGGTSSQPEDNSLLYVIIGAAAAIIAAIVFVPRIKNRPTQDPPAKVLDIDQIFESKEGLHESDKEVVKFINDNGGEALESELRKRFLQPRTTMWRTVKRLERNGIIEIGKRDSQNLVKLAKNMEEEQ